MLRVGHVNSVKLSCFSTFWALTLKRKSKSKTNQDENDDHRIQLKKIVDIDSLTIIQENDAHRKGIGRRDGWIIATPIPRSDRRAAAPVATLGAGQGAGIDRLGDTGVGAVGDRDCQREEGDLLAVQIVRVVDGDLTA